MIGSFGEKKLSEIGACKDERVDMGPVTPLSIGQHILLPCSQEKQWWLKSPFQPCFLV